MIFFDILLDNDEKVEVNISQEKKKYEEEVADTKDESKKQDAGTPGSATQDAEKLYESMILSELRNSGLNIELDNIENYILNNYSRIKEKFSSNFFRLLTGFGKEEIEKNLNYEDFRQELKKKLREKIKKLKKETEESSFLELEMYHYLHELEQLKLKTLFGEKKGKQRSSIGEQIDIKRYQNEEYRKIDIRKTIKNAIKKGNVDVKPEDLVAKEIAKKPEVNLYLLLDTSSSMSGKKIYIAKKASIALAYKVINDGNKIGFIAFNDDIVLKISPTHEFYRIAKEIVKLKPHGKTNISNALKEAIYELSNKGGIKHIILISDILETVDENEVYNAASLARSLNITISIIATEINKEGKIISNRIVELTRGKYYQFRLNELNTIVLEDYSYYANG